MTDRAVLLPERFRAGCAFGAGPALAGPVSPTGQIEVGIVRPPHRLAKLQPAQLATPHPHDYLRFAVWNIAAIFLIKCWMIVNGGACRPADTT